MMDLLTIQHIVVGAIIFAMSCLLISFRRGRRSAPIVPRSQPTMFENMSVMRKQAGLTKLTYIYNICKSFKEADLGRSKYGATFQFSFPMWTPFVFTSDYKLARVFLQGDHEQEKSPINKAMNVLDRNINSILTHDTANTEREKARKALAPSFSTSNLQQTWPYLQNGLMEEFKRLSQFSDSGELMDCRQNILMFMLKMLGKSAFGIDFTDDGTESESNINGLEYLEVQSKAISENMLEFSVPFRKYFFWDKEVQRGAYCCRRLKDISAKMLHLYTQHEADQAQNAKKQPQTIMRALAQHAYPSENARLADINIMTFAGHDTTGFSLCFLLMELGRHPQVRAKLQAELAAVMPKTPLGGAVGGAGLQHGDPRLLSAICGLDYLNCCIKEAMRLWPVAATGSSRVLGEDIHWEGMVIPKGSSILPHNYSMFREGWIDRPLEFLPERWATDNPQLPELKEMFLPFSLGRRACIGQNMAMFQLRVVTAYLLHHFDFTLVGEPDFEYFLTLKPVNVWLAVKERNL